MILIIFIIIITLIIFVRNLGYLLSFKQNTQQVSKTNLPKNITYDVCPNKSSDGISKSKPLVVIFGWINAKNKNLDKFKQMWFERGFDVLIVRASILDALLPPIGSQIVAQNVVKLLSDLNSEYNDIVIHAFSVGGYQFGEVLVQLTRDIRNADILSSFKGFIMDSIVYAKDRAPGIARTMTTNPILISMVERTVNIFYHLFHSVIIRHYNKSEEQIVSPPIKYSGLIFYSKNDVMSSSLSNENLVKNWIKRGNQIRAKCWDKSGHVLHYRHYQQEYEQELDAFVCSLKLKTT